jgi:protein phosphatase
MYIGHVGDSRCYRIRDGQIQLLTRDHSLINDYLLAMPDLTEEQRSELPKNVITRALGMQDQVVVDLQHDDPKCGDVYVLCSDGLSGMVPDDEIKRIITTNEDIRDACKQLIAKANEQGGEDNATVVLIKIEEAPPDSQTQEIAALKTAPPDGEDEPLGMSEEPTAPGVIPSDRPPPAAAGAPAASPTPPAAASGPHGTSPQASSPTPPPSNPTPPASSKPKPSQPKTSE